MASPFTDGTTAVELPSSQANVTCWLSGVLTAWNETVTVALVPTANGSAGPTTELITGVVSARANTVPASSVIFRVPVSSKVTVNRPPDTVPSRLSVVSFNGLVSPLLFTGIQVVPLSQASRSEDSSLPATVEG